MPLETAPVDEDRSRWRLPFTWLGLIALAWIVIEVTHQPTLGAVLVCLKFGWEDFLTARWLWRTDPEPWRRRGTYWLYLSWGLWKTAAIAFLMTVGFALVVPPNPLAQPAVPQALWAFFGTFFTTLVGFGLSALMTTLAVLCAWCGEVRLWLDSAVHRARRQDAWPPAVFCTGRKNRLGHLLLTAMGLATVLLVLALAARGQRGVIETVVLPAFAPVLLLTLRGWISRKVTAATPFECWADAPAADDWHDGGPLR